ncbi:hypothetical protein MASR2M117_00770 [Paludibacter sp.]
MSAFAVNVKTTVNQVTNAVSITTDVDYIITNDTPFTETGSVDIVNTEHAVVIITKIKPSKVITNWLKYVSINGVKAVDGTNCQVKMYNRGAIIFPYGKDIQPLTCYTEKNFGGTSNSNYSEGHSGGYMKTLTDATLNNQIHSFKLKRGYMVTFALGLNGWGYSRCFIADHADIEMNLPVNMAGRVSSYRIFKWHNAHKSGVASTEDAALLDRLGGSWCYGWAVGGSRLPDYENVPNHIYEDYPSSSACGQTTASCHLKTNNEPGNSADDTPQSVEVVLDNWQNLMRTGLRLASETSHDGSWGHLRAFIDSIDARGWRCDLLDLHCYWASGFSNMQSYYTSYGNRPIWISEWVWGASWNNNGIFSAAPDGKGSFSTANQQACYNGTVPILQALNSSKYVERYAYWNWEADCSKLDKGGTLSLLGQYYATMNDGLGYDASLEKVPTVVYRASTNLATKFDNETRTIQLSWNDTNGDMLDSMVVVSKRPGSTQYERIASVALKDMNAKAGASYTFTDTAPNGTNSYRIAVYPIGNKTPKYSNTTTTLIVSQKAVWNDASSHYITNAKFDNSSDFQTANVSNGATNHKKVTGWITTCTDANGSSAVFQIGSSYTLNGRKSPAKDTEENVSGGVLGFSQGWGVESYYTQKITLPAGTYRFSYAVFNVINSGLFTNLCGYKIGTQAYVYDNITSVSVGKWHTSIMDPFTIIAETEVTLSVGYAPAGGTSTSTPYLFFDYVMLEQADMTNVDDAGEEIVWEDITTNTILNNKFDVQSDFSSANLTVGANKKVTSWNATSNHDWGCAGVMQVGSALTVNGQNVPALNADGTATGGVLSFSQGWSGENYYTQTVTLPEGSYRISYAVYNKANPSTSFTSRCGYRIGSKAAVYDGLSLPSIGSWHIKTMEEFILTGESKVTLSLGFKAAESTSTANPFLFFDYIKLEKAELKSNNTSILTPFSDIYADPIAIYNINGIRIPTLKKGINIVKYSDGSAKKVFVRQDM